MRRFDCTENDNHILYYPEDENDLGELRVGDPLEKSWTVIGVKDMLEALKKFGVIT